MPIATQVLLFGAVLPAVVILLWTMRRDRLPEPPKVVITTFILGALATIPILIVNLVLVFVLGFPHQPDSLKNSLVLAFVSAACVEEFFKLAVIAGYAARHDAFDEPYDGIVYGVAASLGFAMVENIMYVFQAGDFGSQVTTAVVRAILSVPLHANCGALIGLGIGIARGRSKGARVTWILVGLGSAILLHGVYNSFAFASGLPEISERGLSLLTVLGLLATSALGAAFVALAAAQLRRDQIRSIARSTALLEENSPPPVPSSATGCRVSHNVAPTAATRIPALPILSLVLAAISGVLWVGAIAVTLALDSMAKPVGGSSDGLNAASPTVELAVGCSFLVGLGLALAAFVTSIAALVQRSGWTAASVAGLITSMLILLAGFAAIALAILGAEVT